MKWRFVLTPEAKADLRDILLDIADDSPVIAERIRSEIYESFQRLGQSPGIGHYHEELLDRRHRFFNFLLIHCVLRLAAEADSDFRRRARCSGPFNISWLKVQFTVEA